MGLLLRAAHPNRGENTERHNGTDFAAVVGTTVYVAVTGSSNDAFARHCMSAYKICSKKADIPDQQQGANPRLISEN